jgi:hypothetical protein
MPAFLRLDLLFRSLCHLFLYASCELAFRNVDVETSQIEKLKALDFNDSFSSVVDDVLFMARIINGRQHLFIEI